MSEEDLKRLEYLKKIKEGRCKQTTAGRNLGISTRQIRRLVRRLEKEGPKGIISKKLGAPGNHRLPHDKTILQLLAGSLLEQRCQTRV